MPSVYMYRYFFFCNIIMYICIVYNSVRHWNLYAALEPLKSCELQAANCKTLKELEIGF